jgi:hypothetical protein
MQSLSDLCLNKIEDSGADTRELSQVELPKQMWTRHPVYKLSCTGDFELHDIDGLDGSIAYYDLHKNIEISFTGVYTVKVTIEIKGERCENVDKDDFERICKHLGLTQYEKVFETLEGEISDDVPEYVRSHIGEFYFDEFVEIAQKNLVAYEVMKIIISDPDSSYVEPSFGGNFNLDFSELYEDGRTDLLVMNTISDHIRLIKYVVSV